MQETLALKDHFHEKRIYIARILVALLFLVALLGLLVGRYFLLQIQQLQPLH